MEMSYVINSAVPAILRDLNAELPVNLSVRYVRGGQYPEEYSALRRQIYCEETNFLAEDQLFDDNDANGEHILIYDGGALIAATAWTPAEVSDFGQQAGIAPGELTSCYYSSRSSVAPHYRRRGLFALLLYLAMRRNRQAGRTSYLAYVEPGDIPARKILRFDYPARCRPRSVVSANGTSYEVIPCIGSIAEGMIRAFAAMPDDLKAWVQANCFTDEIVMHVTKRVTKFYGNRYFRAIRDGRLSRRQYLTSIVNKHHFVRWTTRILGHAVGMCEDPELRKHYADHLSGEVNHEIWLENDIRYLGGDVDFLLKQTVPDVGVLGFQFIQEALTQSRRDPVTFLGVPMAIEAASGFLDGTFIDSLKDCIRSWGYEQPSKGCTFFASHVHTDGADEGHWIGTLRVIARVVRTEQQLQSILHVIDLVIDALERAYGQYMREPGRALDAVAEPSLRSALS